MNTSQRELDSGASTLLWRVSFFRFVHMTIQGSVSEICVTSIRYRREQCSVDHINLIVLSLVLSFPLLTRLLRTATGRGGEQSTVYNPR